MQGFFLWTQLVNGSVLKPYNLSIHKLKVKSHTCEIVEHLIGTHPTHDDKGKK